MTEEDNLDSDHEELSNETEYDFTKTRKMIPDFTSQRVRKLYLTHKNCKKKYKEK